MLFLLLAPKKLLAEDLLHRGLEVKLLLSPEPPLPTVLVSRAGWEVALVVQKGGALAQGGTEQLQHQTAWGGEEGRGGGIFV